MAVTQKEFNTIFRQIMEKEFEHIPKSESEINYIFSNGFEIKIARLLRIQKKAYYRFINRMYKRVILVTVVLLMLFLSACSIKEVRQPIVEFFSYTFEQFERNFFEGNSKEISDDYAISALPEDFHLTDYQKSEIMNTAIYEDDKGNIIEFSQSISDGAFLDIDNEQAKSDTIQIEGINVIKYKKEGIDLFVWVKDNYYFSVVCYGNVEESKIIDCIKSVKKE